MARPVNPRVVTVKLQSIMVEQFEYDKGPGDTVGQLVDKLIQQSHHEGRHPTKLSIDLNPKSDEIDLTI